MNNDCFRNLHLTTAYGRASPQGEAFERFASKPYVSQLYTKIFTKIHHSLLIVYLLQGRFTNRPTQGTFVNVPYKFFSSDFASLQSALYTKFYVPDFAWRLWICRISAKYKSLPLEGKVGCVATRMRWKNKRHKWLHLTTAYGGASPQGEAF